MAQSVMNAEEARARLGSINDWAGSGVAVYILWNRHTGLPVYCGTAKGKRRLLDHLDKDDLQNRPVKTTHRNPDFRAYCLGQPKGWLGLSFELYPNEVEAMAKERETIIRLGIRKNGGPLFNQK